MMMVPRSFLVRDQTRERPQMVRRNSKSPSPAASDRSVSISRSSSRSNSQANSRSSSPMSRTSPVKIPSQKNKAERPSQSPPAIIEPGLALSEPVRPAPFRKSFSGVSMDALLAETAIPTRKKPQGRRSQRLPAGNHVSDFTRLMSEDLQSKELSTPSGSFGNPQLDLLFGAQNGSFEDAMFVGSEGTTPRGISVRSLSSDSMVSMDGDEGSIGTSYTGATTPSFSGSPATSRSMSYRKNRVYSTSRDCCEDHPLNRKKNKTFGPLDSPSPKRTSSPADEGSESRPATPKSQSSFRSNLTASLRALRSAASTVSNLASSNPANRPDDFLTRSIFTFNPELTDDKRPPPSSEAPSPALRRYLNPDLGIPDPHSPGCDFYHYSDSPGLSQPSRSAEIPNRRPQFPASIQLQAYLPPKTRSQSGSASSPPRFGAPTRVQQVDIHPSANVSGAASSLEEGDLDSSDELVYNAKTSFHASPIQVRQREPRENPDFLRMLVCEMQMRKRGKFGDAMVGRATVWLPPRRDRDSQGGERCRKQRWIAQSTEDF